MDTDSQRLAELEDGSCACDERIADQAAQHESRRCAGHERDEAGREG